MFAITKDGKRYSSGQITARDRMEISRQAAVLLKAMLKNKYALTNFSPGSDLYTEFELYNTNPATADLTKPGAPILTTLKTKE